MGFKIENISFSYEEKKVIDNFSVFFESGNFTGIIGPNGCGKTTFLDLLVKHKRAEIGKILYKGKNIDEFSKNDFSKEVALVSQNFYINFAYTVEEIVMMGRHPYIPRFSSPGKEDYSIVKNIMNRTGIYNFKDKLVTRLSGGERQRVVFARALAQDTPVLILDEATSNLDVNHSLSMLNIVSKNVKEKNRTIISVFQDINLAASFCDNIMFMKNGKLVDSGKIEDVLNEENLKNVFNVESKIDFNEFSNSKQVVFKGSNDK